jgi:hypothetical protein
MCLVFYLDTFTVTCEQHRMIAYDVPATHSVDSYFLAAGSKTLAPLNIFFATQCSTVDICGLYGSAAGGVFLLVMMSFDDLDIKIPKYF